MVEDVLVQSNGYLSIYGGMGLNPCCGGRCSSTSVSLNEKLYSFNVLILVVVEDVLVPTRANASAKSVESLNPCCGGRCSSTPRLYNKQHSTNSLNPCCGGRCSST